MSENQPSDGFGGGKNVQRFDKRESGFSREGNRGGGQTQMFGATCADCRKHCEVPFRPIGDKPVYCKECFAKRREEQTPRDFGRGDSRQNIVSRRNVAPAGPQASGARLDDLKRQMDAMNAKLDMVLQKVSTGGSPTLKQTIRKVASRATPRSSKKPRKSATSSKR